MNARRSFKITSKAVSYPEEIVLDVWAYNRKVQNNLTKLLFIKCIYFDEFIDVFRIGVFSCLRRVAKNVSTASTIIKL